MFPVHLLYFTNEICSDLTANLPFSHCVCSLSSTEGFYHFSSPQFPGRLTLDRFIIAFIPLLIVCNHLRAKTASTQPPPPPPPSFPSFFLLHYCSLLKPRRSLVKLTHVLFRIFAVLACCVFPLSRTTFARTESGHIFSNKNPYHLPCFHCASFRLLHFQCFHLFMCRKDCKHLSGRLIHICIGIECIYVIVFQTRSN